MTDAPAPTAPYGAQLREFETGLLGFVASHGLPTAGVFIEVPERLRVFENVGVVLAKIHPDQRPRSIYLSKFIAAAAAGLFDAALNYLWDETISELRRRVSSYELPYFFDNAVSNPAKRNRLRTAEDLDKIDDSELIDGAHKIGLVSDLGLRHLEYVRYMRNWASAAHPNHNQITGLQLISWLETCILEVINLPQSLIVVEIKQLLANIKSNAITETDAREIPVFFTHLKQDQVNSLAAGFFGIYTARDTTSTTRQNIHLLLRSLWGRVDEATRQHFGVRYGRFVANNDQGQKDLARAFLEIVEAGSYIPEDLRAPELYAALEALLTAHRNANNVNTEAPLARELRRLVGDEGRVPAAVSNQYVRALVEVFLTDGNAIPLDAEPIYLELIDRFDAEQAAHAVLSFTDTRIASRLRVEPVEARFRKLLVMMGHKTTAPAVQELIATLLAFPGPLTTVGGDGTVRRLASTLKR